MSHAIKTILLTALLALTACAKSPSNPSSAQVPVSPINLSMGYVYENGGGCIVDQATVNPAGFKILCWGTVIVNSPQGMAEVLSHPTGYVSALQAWGTTLCAEIHEGLSMSYFDVCFGSGDGTNPAPTAPQVSLIQSDGFVISEPIASIGDWRNLNMPDQTTSTNCTVSAEIYDCPQANPGGLTFTLTYGGVFR